MPLVRVRYNKPWGRKGELREFTDEEVERYANYITVLGEPESLDDVESSDESLEEEEVHDLEEEADEDEDEDDTDLTEDEFDALFESGSVVDVEVVDEDE